MAILPGKDYRDNFCEMDAAKACTIQKELIDNWKPQSEVWPLKYGHGIIAVVTATNGLFINSLFRFKLRLLHNGFFMSNFLISVGPAFIAAMMHDQLITNKIILHEARCPPCTGMTAALSANLNSLAYPLVLSPVISLTLAANMGYRIPHIFEYKELLKFWWSVFKPNSKKLTILLLFNAVFADVITYRQFQSMETVTKILEQVEKRLNEKNLQNLVN